MKKKFLITGAAISLSALLGVGAAVGITNAKEPVKAEAAASGTVTIDMTSAWSGSGNACKVAVYFYDASSHNGWSNLVSVSEDQYEAEVSYNLNWTPTKMIAVRLNSSASTPNWDDKWNQTGDLDFGNHIRISDWSEGSTDDYAVVMGGVSGQPWSNLATLNSVKLNGSKHCEYYSTSVSLTAGQAFKIVYADSYYGYYSIGDGIESTDFSGGEGNDIEINKTGTYALYFDASTHNVHIANPTRAAADDWCKDFTDHVGCDATGVNLPTNWSTYAASYAALSGEVKNLIFAANAVEEGGNYIEYAMWQYDWAVAHHDGLTKFVTNSSGTVRAVNTSLTVNHYSLFTADSTTTIALITIVAVTSITAIGAIVFLRVRKHQ